MTMRRPAILLLTLIWILPAQAWARQPAAANLQAALDQARTREGIVGASAAVIGPDLVWTGVSGLSDGVRATRIRPEMIFSAGSITKSFMAALMLQLAEERKLTLGDTLGRWLPNVAAYTPPLVVVPAAIEDPAAAAAGVTRLVPQYDSFGLVIWTPDYGDTSNFNTARLPYYARLDLRVTFRPRWMNDRWQIYGEVVNLFNRDNTSWLNVHLIYNPKSDRPSITLENGDALPFLPTFGLRYRF